MSHTFNINRYIKEESKTITISVPLSQYANIEKLASITHRTVNDVASVIFLDHTYPQICAVLEGKGQSKDTKRSKKATPPAVPQASATEEPASPELRESLPVDSKPTSSPQIPLIQARSDPQPVDSLDRPSVNPSINPPQTGPRLPFMTPTKPPTPSPAAPSTPSTPNANPGSPR